MTICTLEDIQQEIENNDIVLFMKGTPTFPQCGFSANISAILTAEGVSYVTHDVLQNSILRSNINSKYYLPLTLSRQYTKQNNVYCKIQLSDWAIRNPFS